MKRIPRTIRQKGLRAHVTGLGFEYEKLVDFFEHDTPNNKIAHRLKRVDGTTPSEHTVGTWRKIYNQERQRGKHNIAVDELDNV